MAPVSDGGILDYFPSQAGEQRVESLVNGRNVESGRPSDRPLTKDFDHHGIAVSVHCSFITKEKRAGQKGSS